MKKPASKKPAAAMKRPASKPMQTPKKKPASAKSGVKEEEQDPTQVADEDIELGADGSELRDALKSRKFSRVFDSLPEDTKEAYKVLYSVILTHSNQV